MWFQKIFHFKVDVHSVKMNSYRREIFVLLLALSVTCCAANDEQAIRDLCRFRIGNFPHPNPVLCHQYVECQVKEKFKKVLKVLKNFFLD